MPEATDRVLFVINNKAGRITGTDHHTTVSSLLEHAPFHVHYYLLPVPSDEERLRQEVSAYAPHRVIAVGGDGTVALVAKVLAGTKIPMGIIPSGSANGLARELNLPQEPKDALKLAVNGTARAADLIRINEKEICLHLSDLGLNAHVIKFFHDRNFRGMVGYGFALAKALLYKLPLEIDIELNSEKRIKTLALMVVIANARKYGSGATVNPRGSIYDGEFEIIVVHEIGFREIVKMFLGFRKFNPERIEFFKAKTAVIKTGRNTHFQIDGEYKGQVDEVLAEIMPGAINIVTG